MTDVLPPAFADLEPFAAWCLPTEAERYAKRLASSMDELQAFYDAGLPADSRTYWPTSTRSSSTRCPTTPTASCCWPTPWSTCRFRSRCGARPGCPTAVRRAWTPVVEPSV